MAKFIHKMRFRRAGTPKRLQIMAITVVVLAMGAATYFTTYLSRQTDYFTNRHFRELASYSEQISSRIVNVGDAFKNAVSKTVKAKSKVKKPDAKVVAAMKCLDASARKSVKDTFADALLILGQTKFAGIKVYSKGTRDNSLPDYETTADQNADLDDLTVRINVIKGNGEPVSLDLVAYNAENTWGFSGKVNLNDLMKPLIGERELESAKSTELEEGFDDVIIATADDGTVIYDRGTPELNITSLKDVPFSETQEKKLGFEALTNTTSAANVRLGGEDYKFYFQPVTLPLSRIASTRQANSNEPPSHWVVGGLVKSSHFRHQTWKISYTFLVFLAFLCALIALSWPLLKLVFIGPKDRLRLADVYLVSLSFLLASALLTLFLLWGYTYASHQSELDRKLPDLAVEISQQFEKEVDEALTELETMDSELVQKVRGSAGATSAEFTTKPGCYSRTSVLDSASISQKAHHALGEAPAPENRLAGSYSYPFFNAVVWMNPGGQQEILWTISPTLANLHNVRERPYFKEIINGHFLTSSSGKQFFLQSIASRATGSKTALLSKVSDLTFEGSKGVVGMDTNLISLMDPVMPDGFGYRVIDDDSGTVLFQSAESKDWEENFYLECDNNPGLRSLVLQRLGGDLDINYAGKAHHLFVKPLRNFPRWSLIAFRDKQPLRALYLEIVTLAGFLFFGYALVLFVIFFIVYVVRVNSWERMRWIWPAETFSTLYSEFMLANVIWGLLLIAEILFFDGLLLLSFVFLTSWFGIAYLIFRPRFAVIHKLVTRLKLPERLDYSSTYILNMVLVLMIAGMLPATAFFKVTYNKGMALFTRQRQMSLWKGYEDRYSRINSKYSTSREKSSPGPFHNRALADAFIAQRLNNSEDIHEKFLDTSHQDSIEVENTTKAHPQMAAGLASPGLISAATGISSKINTKLSQWLRQVPFFSGFVESDILAQNYADDYSWVSSSDGQSYTLTVPNAWKGGRLLITTRLRDFQSLPEVPTLNFVLAAFGFLTIPVGLFFLSGFAVRRIFLLHLDKRALTPVPQNAFASTNQNLFVIVSSPLIEKDSPPCNGEFHRINLKLETLNGAWFESLDSKLQSGELPKKIVLDYFDHQISDLKKNFQKVDLVERLLANGRIIVIMSNSDPSAYSAPVVLKNGKEKHDVLLPEFADRWANIVSRFIRVYVVESGDVESFQNTLSTQEENFLAYSQSEVQRQKIHELFKLVRSECSPRGCLQKIGLEIIKQPNFETMSLADVFKQIAGQGRLYYHRIWSTCSEEEKLTLVHLAEDRFLSRNDPQLGVLMLKGLIFKAPDLRLINQTFKHFLLTQCSQTGLVSIEDEAKRTSTWHMLRIPLLTGFAAMILFLVLTQKDFYSSSLTIITGLMTGIPALFKVLSVLQPDGTGQKFLQGTASPITR